MPPSPPEMTPEAEEEGNDENATEAPAEEATDAPAAEMDAVRVERQRQRRPRFGRRLRPSANPVGSPAPLVIKEAEAVEIPDAIWDLRQ